MSILFLLSSGVLIAEDKKTETAPENTTAYAAGFAVDFMPYAMSATTGHVGFSLQGYAGYDHFRFRLVGANIFLNDRFIGSSRFTDKKMTVGAAIVDYCFGDHFDKFWIGTGMEYWKCGITHKKSDERISWNDTVFTVGFGYIFRFAGNAYIEPWAAAHCVVNDLDHRTSAGESYSSQRISGEVSLKAGYFFDL